MTRFESVFLCDSYETEVYNGFCWEWFYFTALGASWMWMLQGSGGLLQCWRAGSLSQGAWDGCLLTEINTETWQPVSGTAHAPGKARPHLQLAVASDFCQLVPVESQKAAGGGAVSWYFWVRSRMTWGLSRRKENQSRNNGLVKCYSLWKGFRYIRLFLVFRFLSLHHKWKSQFPVFFFITTKLTSPVPERRTHCGGVSDVMCSLIVTQYNTPRNLLLINYFSQHV